MSVPDEDVEAYKRVLLAKAGASAAVAQAMLGLAATPAFRSVLENEAWRALASARESLLQARVARACVDCEDGSAKCPSCGGSRISTKFNEWEFGTRREPDELFR